MEMVKSLCMTLVYSPGLTCIQEDCPYHNLVDFQLDSEIIVKIDPWLFAFLPLSWHSYPYHLHRGAHLAHQSAP